MTPFVDDKITAIKLRVISFRPFFRHQDQEPRASTLVQGKSHSIPKLSVLSSQKCINSISLSTRDHINDTGQSTFTGNFVF